MTKAPIPLDKDSQPEWLFQGEGTKTGHRYPLARLFEWASHSFATAPAISDGALTWNFDQLERAASEFARLLRAAGVSPGEHVIVLSEKRAVMAAVAVGIWKAGAVYVPVDANAPDARQAEFINQTGARIVIGRTKTLEARGAGVLALATSTIAFEQVIDAMEMLPGHPDFELPVIDENAPAYIIFTSGSTGTPKGVVISHGSLLDYFYNHNQVLQFTPQSRVFSLAPFHFDVSIEDTLLPLSTGAYVFQFHGLHLGPLLRKALRRERITHLIAVSTLLGLITDDGRDISESSFPDLRMLMTGAEVCDPKLIDLWVQRFPNTRVINAYGPTEATIVCLTHTIDRTESLAGSTYPIGKPLPNVDTLLLDDADHVISTPGETGELLIGGSQVMLGYLGRPDETARACPVIDGKRFYRTGDRCYFDTQGRMVYLERIDDMIKIGGQRIHLGEIRQLTMGMPDVVRVAVGEITVGGHSAIAMVVILHSADNDYAVCAIAAKKIRASLAEHLPAYMMPRLLALTGEQRLTSSGKTDEKALLARVRQAVPEGHGDYFISHDLSVFSLSRGSNDRTNP